jgi:uncharacterized protein
MKMSGEYLILAPPARVWEGLNEPDILRECIPGCESLVRVSETELAAKATLKIGPAKMTFGGTVRLSEINPPHGYRISGEAQGGASGFAKGGAVVALEPTEDGTLLRYEGDAQIGGKLAQMGSRLIDATSRKMADDFFRKFAEYMTAEQEAGDPASRPAESPGPDNALAPAESALGNRTIWLIAGGAVLLALLAWALYR